jgi:hypothetical protein
MHWTVYPVQIRRRLWRGKGCTTLLILMSPWVRGCCRVRGVYRLQKCSRKKRYNVKMVCAMHVVLRLPPFLTGSLNLLSALQASVFAVTAFSTLTNRASYSTYSAPVDYIIIYTTYRHTKGPERVYPVRYMCAYFLPVFCGRQIRWMYQPR